jgi:hypothetical protein
MSETVLVERLAVSLRSLGYEVSAVDLADILWLARHLPTSGTDAIATAPPPRPTAPPTTTPPPAAGAGAPSSPAPAAPAPARAAAVDERQGLYPVVDRTGAGASRRASIIRAPAAPALPNALALSRALRPLLKRRVSTREWRLDEAATVDATAANGGMLSPVFRLGAERWFEVALVVDEAPSMFVWRQAVVELRRLMTRHGGFRDLRQYRLRGAAAGVELVTESGRIVSPDAIADPSGHRLIAIVTDAVSPEWLHAPLRRTVFNWARLSPVVMIDVLPRRMWPLSSLGFADRPMRALRAGAPNIAWTVERDWWAADGPSLPLPVITLEADQFAQWAQSLMNVSATECTGTMIGTTEVRAQHRHDDRHD